MFLISAETSVAGVYKLKILRTPCKIYGKFPAKKFKKKSRMYAK